jgi:NAD+ synthase (glutamine-hydrolysing)
MPTLRIAIAQINCTVGDLAANAARIQDFAARAAAQGADLLLTPELALCGYPPEDLLLRPDFYRAAARHLADLAASLPLPAIVGHPAEIDGAYYNCASLLADGEIKATYRKQALPNADVLDEKRYFHAGGAACVVPLKGVALGVVICEDIWQQAPVAAAAAAGAQVLLALNASPYHMSKVSVRQGVVRERVAESGLPLVYANMVGGQDELIFDGASFAIDPRGGLTHQLPWFEEDLAIVEFRDGILTPGARVEAPSEEAEVYAALKLGVRDYIGKNGFPGALLGLSGGIDSALTLCIAADALGPDKVRAVMLPSPYTAQMSLDDSRALVEALGVRYDEVPIKDAMAVYDAMLTPLFSDLPPTACADTTPENIQARIRGMVLMALSNRTGRIVLTTGNKSEMAVGYATLYGDMAGGFAVIKDVFKTFVYRLCRYRNSVSPVIPENIIIRPPSAELKPDQTDQDTLPEYDVLDAIIAAYMEEDRSPREIIAAGYDEATVRKVVGMLKRNEYKRRQSPVGIRVSRRGFGKDWRYPITSRFQDEY